MQIPDWWCDENSTKNLSAKGVKPSFKEADVYGEYLRREMDDVMCFDTYKHARSEVIDIV